MAAKPIPSPLLMNAARAFAMVCLSDGRIDPTEEHRFVSAVAAEPALKGATREETAAAWLQAVREVEKSKSFGGPLVSIRSEITTDEDKAMMMRVAQTAIVADTEIEVQESLAIRYLAEALGFDPERY